MFSEKLQPLVDLISRANDRFDAAHEDASTAVGVMNQSLRARGDDSDAVSIECNHSKQKLMFIMKDSIPGKVGIGVGTRGTEKLKFIGEARLENLDEAGILSLMEQYFTEQARH